MTYEQLQIAPFSGFDLFAIGVVLWVVLIVLGARRLWRWASDAGRNDPS